MSYRVLARKYRPQTFEEIVGQAHVATTLTNALKNKKVAHAYLFSGPRGVGKTTAARILAKALNCEKGPAAEPCNECDFCKRIALGHEIVDVMEIDAASNRGIEEIRELRENVVYAPAQCRYKVYIIDEAHQITHDAFNAFLKTLEEPPAHAVFILATTEHQKIPATILSRCQLFRFKRISQEDIAAQLERLLAKEKVPVEKAALVRLARAAGGAMRDALSLLDQALAYASDSLNVQQVELLLGFLPDEFLEGFAGAILARDPSNVLQWAKRLADEGWDLPQFVRDFREYLRDAMVKQLAEGARPEALALAGKPIRLPELLQMIKVMGQVQDEMRWNDNPRLVLELYGVRLTQPFVDAGSLLQRLDQLEKNGTPANENDSQREHRPTQETVKGSLNKENHLPPPTLAETPVNRPSRQPPLDVSTAGQWKALLSELWKRPLVGAQLERARLQSAAESEWVIAFQDRFGLDMAQKSLSLIQESVAKIAGKPVKVRLVQASVAAEPDPVVVTRDERPVERPLSRPAERQPAAVKDTGVQKILQTFKGRIREEDPGEES
jgi:DNA polymerase-3 subunit gamma/tau